MPSPARRFEKRASLDNLVERVDAQRPGEITGDTIPTGFGSLDKLLGGGFRRRDLILLGGDIGSGKSALALGISLRVAQQSVGVAYFSGEMNEERLMERALAIEGKVAVDELRAAKLNDQTRAGVGAAAGPSSFSFGARRRRLRNRLRAAGSFAAGRARRRRLPAARPTTEGAHHAGRRHGPRAPSSQGTRAGASSGAARRRAASRLSDGARCEAAVARRLRRDGGTETACRRHPVDFPRGDVQPGRRRRWSDRADRRQEPQRPNRIRRSVFLPALDAIRGYARPG